MTKTSELTYEEELQRIAEKYGCGDIYGVQQALADGDIERNEAKQLLMELGSPMRKINMANAMKASGLAGKPEPGSAEEACVQAAMKIIMQLLKHLLGIQTTDDIEREREQREAMQQHKDIEQKHGSLMQTQSQIDAANDDEDLPSTKACAWRP